MRLVGTRRCRWEGNIKIDQGNRIWTCGLDLPGSGEGPVVGCCEYGDEVSSSIKGVKFHD
jgi:hypothetical protein